ncbi:hypothetical protein SBV1_2440003 [Verrucomicrobia bacterium]|nr:hypothetical protein SBV1_2440003 [Verrucomicrobiota bacterium]
MFSFDALQAVCVIAGVKGTETKVLVTGLLAFRVLSVALAQSPDAAASFFRQQGLLLTPPPSSNAVAVPQMRAPNLPDQAKQETFDTLAINGVTYTNVLLRTINASEGALHHDGGLVKIRLGDLPEPVRIRFCEPASLRLVGGHAVSTNGWPRLSGEVTGLRTNGVLVRLDKPEANPIAFVACNPVAEGFYDGAPFDLAAQKAGTAQIDGKTIAAYDAGLRYQTR